MSTAGIADHHLLGGNLLWHTVTNHGRPSGHHLPQPLGSMLSTLFLREGEDAVENDHHEDRDAQLG
jgi:hypothetical protein